MMQLLQCMLMAVCTNKACLSCFEETLPLCLLQISGPLGVLNGGPIELSNGTNCFENGQLDNFLLEVPAGQDCGSPITQVCTDALLADCLVPVTTV